MRKLPTISAAAAAAALLLAGCTTASEEPTGSTGSPTEGETAATTEGFDISGIAADEEIAALVPEGVASDGTLTVGSNLEYAPAEFVAADGTTPVGYDIDIIGAVAKVMDLEVDVQSSSFDAIIPGIGSRYEVGISSFTINPERLQSVNMVSYFVAGSQFAVAAGNPEDVDPENLCGVTVGVQTATIQQEELDAATTECTDAGEEPIEVLPFDSQADVTTNLAGGRLDAMYADSPIVAYAVEQTGGTLEALGEIRDAAPYGIVVAKEDTELAEAVRAALQKLMDDGTMAAITEAWGNSEGALTTAEINPNVG
jgi:polar amino acid transport system substrate-binding protein